MPIAYLADEDSLMRCIVMMGRQTAKMFYTFSLSLFLMVLIFCYYLPQSRGHYTGGSICLSGFVEATLCNLIHVFS